MPQYDYLIVGAGLFGATFAQQAVSAGLKCLMLDKRDHIGGNCYTETTSHGIILHKYGPHIFHTNSREIWDYVNKFTEFNSFVNRPKVLYKNQIFSFPINLFSLYQLWGVTTPQEAYNKIQNVKIKCDHPQNLEEWILNEVGEEIYYTFIYGYTKKQWGTEPKNLPTFIIKRLPIRLSFDDNYFMDTYQGIPKNGYTSMIANMLIDTKVELGIDYFNKKDQYDRLAKQVVYTGPIDKFFDYAHGPLDYRSLRFETVKYDMADYQGNAIINYTDESIPFTRSIEHKHFDQSTINSNIQHTIITKEFPQKFDGNNEPFYPINNPENTKIYSIYEDLYKERLGKKFIFGGRLAEYRYYDMHQIIASAIHTFKKLSK